MSEWDIEVLNQLYDYYIKEAEELPVGHRKYILNKIDTVRVLCDYAILKQKKDEVLKEQKDKQSC